MPVKSIISEDSMPAGPLEQKPLKLRALRFSMRRLMQFMTGFAIFCGLTVVMPIYISHIILGAFWIAVTGWLATGVIFAKDDQRAFCIGAIIVVSSMWTGMGGQFAEGVTRLLWTLSGGMPISSHVSLWAKTLLLDRKSVA